MIRHSPLPSLELQNLLCARAREHGLQPLLGMRVLVRVELVLLNLLVDCVLPRDEGEVRVGELAAYEPEVAVRVRLLHRQVIIEYTSDAADLLDVALARAGKLLVVVHNKPHSLPVVRALAGGLEVEPLTSVVELSRACGEAQLVVLVVGLRQILQNGARLPQREVCVRVLERRQPAVDVDGKVVRLLDVVERDVYRLIRESELLAKDRNLRGVRPVNSQHLDRLEFARHDE
jgi:hypothetical protein